MTDVFDTIDHRSARASAPRVLRLVTKDVACAYALPRSASCVIGRSKEVEAHIDDASVSRRHAKLLLEGGRILLEDLGSKNGTRTAHALEANVPVPMPINVDEVFSLGDVAAIVHEGPLDARATSDVGTDELWQRLEAAVRIAEHASQAVSDTAHGCIAVCVFRGASAADARPPRCCRNRQRCGCLAK